MHKFNHQSFDEYPHVVYPGTPFAGFHSDLEENAKGMKRGYVLVDFDSIVNSVDFVEVENTEYEIIEVDAHNRKPESVNSELNEKTRDIDVENKVVIIKVQGELMSGKTSDVDLSSIRDIMAQSGPLVVNISKNQLTSKEFSITEAKGSNKDEVETNVFAENIGQFGHLEQKHLVGSDGVKLAKKLLRELGQPILSTEKKNEYIPRIKKNALGILGEKDDS